MLVTAFATATLTNVADTGETRFSDTASAYIDETTSFYSSGPFRLGLISLDYEVATTFRAFGSGAVTLIVSDGVHTYDFSVCPEGAGDECYGFELLPFDLGTAYTVTAIAAAGPIYMAGDGEGYVSLSLQLTEAANGQLVESMVVPEGGTWIMVMAGLVLAARKTASSGQ